MIRRLLALAASLVILGGCTSIPNSGDVLSAELATPTVSAGVDVLPPGPSAGATQEDILVGFIAAGAAAQDNYRVARSYLTQNEQAAWNPNALTLIRSGEPIITPTSGSELRYEVAVAASVDELGQYLNSPGSSNQALDFQFVRESGEWRISSAPDGIVVSEAAFQEAFDSYRLYYFSSGYRDLVADLRWFASRGEVSTKIVRALLAPPAFWLDQGATVSAFPAGTGLALTPIPVVDGVATVDLTSAVVNADDTARARMLVQLNASLQQVQGISSARISINQNELVIPALGDEGPTLASGRDPRLVVLANRSFGFLQSGQFEEIDVLSQPVATLIPDSIFYSQQFNEALLTRGDGLWRVDGVGQPSLLDGREGLVRGIIDSCGYSWSSTSTLSADMISVFDSSGVAGTLGLELVGESSLVSFELARDNTRLLLLIQSPSGVRVLVTSVARDSDCRPESFSDFVELGVVSGDAIDAAWVDDTSVAVVTEDPLTQLAEVTVFAIGGRSSSLGQPARPVTLVGGVGGVSGLRILSEDGIVYQPRGQGWQATSDRASVLATQR